jgi:hypothetical protein
MVSFSLSRKNENIEHNFVVDKKIVARRQWRWSLHHFVVINSERVVLKRESRVKSQVLGVPVGSYLFLFLFLLLLASIARGKNVEVQHDHASLSHHTFLQSITVFWTVSFGLFVAVWGASSTLKSSTPNTEKIKRRYDNIL